MPTINGENYQVEYTPETATISIGGALRLGGLGEYAPSLKRLTLRWPRIQVSP